MKEINNIADLTPDPENPNAGTERGDYLLETSIQQTGVNRGIVVDKHGVIVAGNKTAGKAGELGIDDVILVQTDGKKTVVIQRTDWDLLEDREPRLYSYLDNHAALHGIELDLSHANAHEQQGVDFSGFMTNIELDEAGLKLVAPDFQPVDASEQGRLDEKQKNECPNCGHVW